MHCWLSTRLVVISHMHCWLGTRLAVFIYWKQDYVTQKYKSSDLAICQCLFVQLTWLTAGLGDGKKVQNSMVQVTIHWTTIITPLTRPYASPLSCSGILLVRNGIISLTWEQFFDPRLSPLHIMFNLMHQKYGVQNLQEIYSLANGSNKFWKTFTHSKI